MLKTLIASALLLCLLIPAAGQDFTATSTDFQKLEVNGLVSSPLFCGEDDSNVYMFSSSVGGMALNFVDKASLLITKTIKIDFTEIKVGKKSYPIVCAKVLVSGGKLIAVGKIFDKKARSLDGLYIVSYNLDGTINKEWTKLDDKMYIALDGNVGSLTANAGGLVVFNHTEAGNLYFFDNDLKLLSVDDEDGNEKHFYGLIIFKTVISKSGKIWMLGKDEDGCTEALQLSLSADGEVDVEESNAACFKTYNYPEVEAVITSLSDYILSDYKIVDDRYLVNYGIIVDSTGYTGTFFSKFDMKENKMLVETKTDFTEAELEEFKIKLPVYDKERVITYHYLTPNPALYAVKQQQGNEENAFAMTFQKMYATQYQGDKGTITNIFRQDMFTFRYDAEGNLLWKTWLPAQQEYSVYGWGTISGLAYINTNTENASFYTVDVTNGAFGSWGTNVQTDEAKSAAKSSYGVGIIKIDNTGKAERIPVFGLNGSDNVKNYTHRSGRDIYLFAQGIAPLKIKVKMMKISIK